MEAITSLQGDILLDPKTISEIESQTRIIQKNNDVAAAWSASRHLKSEIAKIPSEKVKPLLDRYRAINAKLKVVALSLLDQEEMRSLLKNNFALLSDDDIKQLNRSLSSWLVLQDAEQVEAIKKELRAIASQSNASAASSLPVLFSKDESAAVSQKMPVPSEKKPVNVVKPDAVFFDKEEQEDIAHHATVVSALSPGPLNVSSAVDVAKKIAALRTDTHDAEQFVSRAEALVASRLHDIRTIAQLKDYFGKPFTVGGLGLSGEAAQKAGVLVEDAYRSLHSAKQVLQKPPAKPETAPPAPIAPVAVKAIPRPQKQKQQDNLSPSVDAKISKPIPVSNQEPQKQKAEKPAAPIQKPSIAPTTDLAAEIDALIGAHAPVAVKKAETAATSQPKEQDAKPVPVRTSESLPAEKKPPVKIPAARPTSIVRPRSTTTKPRLDDITQGAKPLAREAGQEMVGQADELKYLTLADFRMHGTPEEAVSYIVQRIRLLGEDSAEDRFAGIQQFRSSELFTHYLHIGSASLSGGTTLAAALADTKLNPEGMTEDEFFAIASLNSKLK